MTGARRPPVGLEERVAAWAVDHYGQGVSVQDLVVLPGHAGLTYGFDILDGRGNEIERLVLRLPPAGVRRHGNTDVLRQVPLLDALATAGVPVAPVRHAGADERWFDVPYLAIAWMPGRTVSIDAGGEPPKRAHYVGAAQALAAVHAVPWELRLRDWSRPRTYGDEVRSWDRALEKSVAPASQRAADAVRAALLAREPAGPATGITHGDYQLSNLLFDGDRLSAILDWEISGIGPHPLDLAWFLVVNDERSWAHKVFVGDRPADEELRREYEAAAGHEVDGTELAYAKALAAYRFAVIAGLNLSLHRAGRRVDDHWEIIAPSIAVLFERALDDLSGR